MRRIRIACWLLVAVISLGSFSYFSYFESSHHVPHIEQLSPHSIDHDH
ncbi:hypothetical protein JCM19233_6862 [Vibrio astriarenae]|nr:hypothetical protein JCM19233_6862 [Vibrio sp. C7]